MTDLAILLLIAGVVLGVVFTEAVFGARYPIVAQWTAMGAATCMLLGMLCLVIGKGA